MTDHPSSGVGDTNPAAGAVPLRLVVQFHRAVHVRAVGDERLELPALTERVDTVRLAQVDQVRERVVVQPAAQPRLVEPGGRDLDDRDLEAGRQHLLGEIDRLLLPQRGEQVDPEPVTHPLDPGGLERRLDRAGGDTRDRSVGRERRQSRLHRLQFAVTLTPGVRRRPRLEVVGVDLDQRNPDTLGGQRRQSGLRNVVHVRVVARVDGEESLDGQPLLQRAV